MRTIRHIHSGIFLISLGLVSQSVAQPQEDLDISSSGYIQSSDVDRGAAISGGDPIVGLEIVGALDSGLYGLADSKSRQTTDRNAGLESRLGIGYATDFSNDLSGNINAANTWLLGPGDNEDFFEITGGMTYSQPSWQLRGEAILDFEGPDSTLQGEWMYTPAYEWFGFIGGGFAAFAEDREDRVFASGGLGRRWQQLDVTAAYHTSSLSKDELSGIETDPDQFLLRLRVRY